MNYCSKCGMKLPEGVRFCPGCGAQVAAPEHADVPKQSTPAQPAPTAQSAPAQPVQSAPVAAVSVPHKPRCALSVTGFVFSMLSIIGFLFLSLPGLIISAVAVGKKRDCRGLAVAGLIVSIFALLLLAVAIFATIKFVLPLIAQMGA